VRSKKLSTLATVAVMVALLVSASPAAAQEYEEFPRPGVDEPLEGYTRSDGTIVLTDEAFCSFLLGSLWGSEPLTFAGLIDKTKKQKKARAAAFVPAIDEATLQQCGETIRAFREAAPDEDVLAAWARLAPVVPEALVGLLPADFEADPLAVPAPIGEATRSSGFGDVITPPFSVGGGTWLVEVDAVACDTWAGSLGNARDATDIVELADIRQYLYDVTPGHYYWEVSAPDCDWSIDLVPVDLGPEPTPTPVPQAVVPKLFGEKWDRRPDVPNESWLTAARARAAVHDVGLVTGVCHDEDPSPVAPDRVWQQDPVPGALLDYGEAVDVWMGADCDIYRGERVPQ